MIFPWYVHSVVSLFNYFSVWYMIFPADRSTRIRVSQCFSTSIPEAPHRKFGNSVGLHTRLANLCTNLAQLGGLGHRRFQHKGTETPGVLAQRRGTRTCQMAISGSNIMSRDSVSRSARCKCQEVPEYLSGRNVRTHYVKWPVRHTVLESPCEFIKYLGYHNFTGIKWIKRVAPRSRQL